MTPLKNLENYCITLVCIITTRLHLRSPFSYSQKWYHDVILLDSLNILGRISAFFIPFQIKKYCPSHSLPWRQLAASWYTEIINLHVRLSIPDFQFLSNFSNSFHPADANSIEATNIYPSDEGRTTEDPESSDVGGGNQGTERLDSESRFP